MNHSGVIRITDIFGGFDQGEKDVGVGYSREFIWSIFAAGAILSDCSCSDNYVSCAHQCGDASACADSNKSMCSASSKLFNSNSSGWSANSG